MSRLPSTGASLRSVADTATETFVVRSVADKFKITVAGTGTGTVQPVLQNGSETHQAYTVSDDTIVLDIPNLKSIKITASGGAIEAQIFGYQD